MLAWISVGPGTTPGPSHHDRMGVLVVVAAPLRSATFWDPVAFSWPLMGFLLAITAMLTIGFVVWMVLQPEEPEHDTKDLVDRATRRDRESAHMIRRRLDADSGRADTSEPDLR